MFVKTIMIPDPELILTKFCLHERLSMSPLR